MADAPRIYFVITNRGNRGEIGPLSKPELREQFKAGAFTAADRVRNAFGRQLGTVAEVLGESSARLAEGSAPAKDPPRRRNAPARSPMPLVIAIVTVVVGAVLIAVSVARSPGPPPAVDSPQPVGSATAPPRAASKAANTRPVGSLPIGWLLQDVGGSLPKGKVKHTDGTWSIDGGGKDFWDKADLGSFLQHPLAGGDFTATVRLLGTSLAAEGKQLKVGLMLRADDDPAAPQTGIVVMHDNGVWFQRRAERGGKSEAEEGPKVTLPVWLRLQRRGDEFSAAHSADGTAWKPFKNPLRLPALSGPARLGLVVASWDETRTGRGMFDGLTVDPPEAFAIAPPP